MISATHFRSKVQLALAALIAGAFTAGAQITTYSFTTASATGSVGPTQTQIASAYASTNLSLAVQSGSSGIQSWTVPVSGLYRITAAGASGGNTNATYNKLGGLGSALIGEFNLVQGDAMQILVGQRGTDGCGTGGGGGGSYVVRNGNLLIAAGGGGGATSDNHGAHSTTLTSGTNDFPGGAIAGGVNGGGGGVCNSGGANHGGGGGGFSGDGGTSILSSPGGGGYAFLNGGWGGFGNAPGGFGGGGGGTNCTVGGGGGGGYSGGAGGQQVNYCMSGINRSGGGGGGSYNSGTNQVNTEAVNNGDGKVIIENICNVGLSSTSNPICIGESVVLSTNATNVSWGHGGSNSTTTVTPNTTTSYSVTGTSTANCITTAVITITVNPLPSITAVSLPSVLCVGETGTINAVGAASYTWQPGNLSGNLLTVSPNVSTIYTVTGQSVHNCRKTETISMIVNSNQLTVSPDTTICQGDPVYLRASGAQTYAWNNGATFAHVLAHPASASLYTVSGVDAFGCTITGSVSVSVKPKPNVTVSAASTVVCRGEPVELTAAGASSYQWSNGASGATISPIAFADVLTAYTVTGVDAQGCKNTASILVLVEACLGVAENSPAAYAIYPNPAHNRFVVSGPAGSRQISVFDVSGKKICATESELSLSVVDLPHISAGIYQVLITQDGRTTVSKLVIE